MAWRFSEENYREGAQRWLRPQPNKDLTQRRKGAEKQKKSRPLFSFTSLTSLRLCASA
jgi:hypothetical protein